MSIHRCFISSRSHCVCERFLLGRVGSLKDASERRRGGGESERLITFSVRISWANKRSENGRPGLPEGKTGHEASPGWSSVYRLHPVENMRLFSMHEMRRFRGTWADSEQLKADLWSVPASCRQLLASCAHTTNSSLPLGSPNNILRFFISFKLSLNHKAVKVVKLYRTETFLWSSRSQRSMLSVTVSKKKPERALSFLSKL